MGLYHSPPTRNFMKNENNGQSPFVCRMRFVDCRSCSSALGLIIQDDYNIFPTQWLNHNYIHNITQTNNKHQQTPKTFSRISTVRPENESVLGRSWPDVEFESANFWRQEKKWVAATPKWIPVHLIFKVRGPLDWMGVGVIAARLAGHSEVVHEAGPFSALGG